MNGHFTQFLILLASGLLALVNALIAFIVHLHLRSDYEHRERMDKEIGLLRRRVHEFGNRVAELITRARWLDEDKDRSGRHEPD
jgi:hypothetical protein